MPHRAAASLGYENFWQQAFKHKNSTVKYIDALEPAKTQCPVPYRAAASLGYENVWQQAFQHNNSTVKYIDALEPAKAQRPAPHRAAACLGYEDVWHTKTPPSNILKPETCKSTMSCSTQSSSQLGLRTTSGSMRWSTDSLQFIVFIVLMPD